MTETEMVERLNEILASEYEVADTSKIEADMKALAVIMLSVLQKQQDTFKSSAFENHLWVDNRCLLCGIFQLINGNINSKALIRCPQVPQ